MCAVGCTEYHGARPIVMCGATLSQGGLSAPVVVDEVPTDSPLPGSATETAYAGTLVLVSRGCGTGADVAFSQPEVTMGPVAYAKDGKPVIFAVSSANAPRDVVMTVTAHGHLRTVRLLVIGSSTAGDSRTAENPSATRNP